MYKIKLKLWLMRLPIVGAPLQSYFVKRLARQERSLSVDGANTEIFSRIYRENLWAEGASPQGFYSGSGTHGPSGKAYVAFLANFIRENKVKSMTDIGSGDFAIGKAITDTDPALHYNGVDVAGEVIEFNKKTYGSDRIKFFHLDASTQDVPSAELLTIRQVLQHLSNHDIGQILKQASRFKFALITEHVLDAPYLVKANIDKPGGKSTRAGFASAVLIHQPPFNLKCREVFRCREDEHSHIVTFLVENQVK
jgi:hypothetical protein